MTTRSARIGEYSSRIKERTEQKEKDRRVPDSFFVCAELPQVLRRFPIKDKKLLKILEEWTKTKKGPLAECVVKKKNGIFFDLRLMAKNPEVSNIAAVLEKDITFRGLESQTVISFAEHRRSVTERSVGQLKKIVCSRVDYDYEIADNIDDSESENGAAVKEAYLRLQSELQVILDRIFSTTALRKFKPIAQLTRCKDANAFVLGDISRMSRKILDRSQENSDDLIDFPVFVHLGLFQEIESMDEIAGILSHEFAHLLQPLTGKNDEPSVRKRLEFDADAEALKLADAAGYNPRALMDFFRRNSGKERELMTVIFGKTHPPTPDRIKQMELLFHRNDLPFPNGAKPKTLVSDTLQADLDLIKKNEVGEWLLQVSKYSDDEMADKLLNFGSVEEKEHWLGYSTWDFKEIFGKKCEDSVKWNWANQELVHGKSGVRDKFLKDVKKFFNENLDKDLSEFRPNQFFLVDKLPTVNLDISWNHEKWTTKFDKLSAAETDDSPGDSSVLGDWLSDDPKDEAIKKFWDFVKVKHYDNKDWTLSKKASVLAFYLSNIRDGVQVVAVETVKERVVDMEVEAPPSKDSSDGAKVDLINKKSVLRSLPLFGRAARKDDGSTDIAEPKKTQTITRVVKDVERSYLVLGSDKSKKFYVDLWEDDFEKIPAHVRDSVVLYQNVVASEIKKYLVKGDLDSFYEIPDEAVRFVYKYISSIDYRYTLLNVLDPKDISITKLYEIYRVLKLRKLPDFMVPGRYLRSIISELEAVMVFGLNPQNNVEELIVEELRSEMELLQDNKRSYGVLYRGPLSVAESLPRNTNYTELTTHASVEDGGEKIGVVKFPELGPDELLLAIAENCWKQKGEEIISKLKSEEVVGKKGKVKEEVIQKIVDDYLNWIYEEGVLLDSTIEKLLDYETEFRSDYSKGIAHLLMPLVRSLHALGVEKEKYPEFNENAKSSILSRIVYDADSSGIFERFRKVSYTLEKNSAYRPKDKLNLHGLSTLLCVPKSEPMDGWFDKDRYPLINDDEFLEYMNSDSSSQEEKDFGDFYKKLRSGRKDKFIPGGDKMRLLGIGFLLPFDAIHLREQLYFGKLRKEDLSCREVVTFFRLAEKIYGEKWKDLEQYKRMDEQLSHWEWLYDNPFIKFEKKKKEKDEQSGEFMAGFSKKYGDVLGRIYPIDQGNTSEISFSWPLFLQDVVNDNVPYQKFEQLTRERMVYSNFDEFFTSFKEGVTFIKDKILLVVSDRKNLEEIKRLQPGFFREFLLEMINKQHQAQSLEDVESQVGDYRSSAHEVATSNQTSLTVENLKNEESLVVQWQILTEAFAKIDPSEFKEIRITEDSIIFSVDYVYFVNREENNFLLGTREFSIFKNKTKEQNEYFTHHDPNKWLDAMVNGESVVHRPAIKYEELPEKFRGEPDSLHNIGFGWKKIVEEKYRQLVLERTSETVLASMIPEEKIYLFSDKMTDSVGSFSEFDPAFRYRRVTQPLMDWHAEELRNVKDRGSMNLLEKRVFADLPEKNQIRDLFCANQLNVEIYHLILDELGEAECRELGISLNEEVVDLQEVFSDIPQLLENVFLKKYSIFELSVNPHELAIKLPPELTKRIVDLLEVQMNSGKLSEAGKYKLRKWIVSLEETYLWPDLLKEARKNKQVSRDYLQRILTLYPVASIERDDILERVGMNLVTEPSEIHDLWSLRYDEQIKWPEKNESVELEKQFNIFEKTKEAIRHMNVPDRIEHFVWFLGGSEPSVYKMSGQKTNVSVDSRKKMFWSLTDTERKILLYEFLLGQRGLMEIGGKSAKEYNGEPSRVHLSDSPWPNFPKDWSVNRDEELFKYVLEQVFALAFEGVIFDEKLPQEHPDNLRSKEVVRLIFFNLFTARSDVSRRAELMINFTEALGVVKKDNKKMNAGELVRLMLEQVGVVGIKTGQVLSEQPDLLPENLRKELGKLKDKAPEFSKRAILTYLESAGINREEGNSVEEIGEIVGSASIKEVVRGRTASGQEVAIKAKRPSIDKYYTDDVEVLKTVVSVLNKAGYAIPEGLIIEIERSIREELSFVVEAENQRAMQESLRQRGAKMDLRFKNGEVETIALDVNATLDTPTVDYPDAGEVVDTGLMVEEFVRGLSLKDIKTYQQALEQGDEKGIAEIGAKIKEMYGQSSIDVDRRIRNLDVDYFQAQIALELVREVVSGGVFHADLHSGNIYLDLAALLKTKATMIDLGSAGYSTKDLFPIGREQKMNSPGESSAKDFRDFITGLFGMEMAPEKCLPRLLELIEKYASPEVSREKLEGILSDKTDTKGKVQKLFYALLEGKNGMDDQFRFLLKAMVTAADHLDKMKVQIIKEYTSVTSGEIGDEEAIKERYILMQLVNEGLVNIEMLGY